MLKVWMTCLACSAAFPLLGIDALDDSPISAPLNSRTRHLDNTQEGHFARLSAPIPKNEWFIHRVVPGETLAFLLKLYGIEQDRLFQLNGIEDAETFRPGLLLKIP